MFALEVQGFELALELVRGLERPVDGRKSDVRDAVELAQMKQRGLADRLRRHLREPVAAEPRLDGRDDALDRLERHRPLDAGALEAAQQLRAIERLTAAVALDDPQRRLLEALERREARVAVEALAATADGLARVAHARFQHARLGMFAGGQITVSATSPSVACPKSHARYSGSGIGRSRDAARAGRSLSATDGACACGRATSRARPAAAGRRTAEREDRRRHLIDVRRADAREHVRDRPAHRDRGGRLGRRRWRAGGRSGRWLRAVSALSRRMARAGWRARSGA